MGSFHQYWLRRSGALNHLPWRLIVLSGLAVLPCRPRRPACTQFLALFLRWGIISVHFRTAFRSHCSCRLGLAAGRGCGRCRVPARRKRCAGPVSNCLIDFRWAAIALAVDFSCAAIESAATAARSCPGMASASVLVCAGSCLVSGAACSSSHRTLLMIAG